MQITDVSVRPVVAETDRVVSGSNYTKTQRATIVVEVHTGTDVTGRIYSGVLLDVNPELGRRFVEIIDTVIAPVVIGEDLHSVDRHWKRMFQTTTTCSLYEGTDRYVFLAAIGAVDVAVWDAIGTAAGEPLSRLWGGARDTVPVLAIGGYYEDGKGTEEIRAEIEAYEKLGVAGVKFKIGDRSPEEDLARVEAAHEVASDGFEIAVDANQGYTIDEAVAFGRMADHLDLLWFEEPVVWYNQYDGMRTVRERTDLWVVAGQSEHIPRGCRRLVEDGSVDILNYDATIGGGATAWRRVAGFAEIHGVSMGHHHSTQVGLQLLASTASESFAEIFAPGLDPLWYEMVENTPDIEDGEIRVPKDPGFGLTLDESFIDEHEVKFS
ncbi:mandelate racemase/muconate lactonizing enzyme family protein [Halobellus salinisoli]|uniref:mandelate racemase/muconate lactonizing enzyme family protein n=1 Tax=Halobellus salinisoli TaxID=3108500 RepID=UPI00300B5358